MRSENETIHYRARFELRPQSADTDVFSSVIQVLLRWFAGKEKAAGRAGFRAALARYPKGSGSFADDFLAGNVSLPNGYEGGVGSDGMSSVCTHMLVGDGGDPACWAFEYDEVDKANKLRHWHTCVGVSRRGAGACVVNVRISYYLMPGYFGRPPFAPYCTTPRFVKELVNLPGVNAYVGDTRVLREECYLNVRFFAAFRESLLSPQRALPLILITTDWDGATAVWDATELADKVLGMANVYVLDWRNDDLRRGCLFRLFPRDTPAYKYSCGVSTLRIYQPGVSLEDEGDCHRHRFFKKEYIDKQWREDHDGFVETISRSLSRGFVTDEQDIIDAGSIRRKASEQNLRRLHERAEEMRKRIASAQKDSETKAPPDGDLRAEVDFLRKELERVEDESREWEELAVEYSEAVESNDSDDLKAEVRSLEGKIGEMQDERRKLEYRNDALQDENNTLREKAKGLERLSSAVGEISHIPTNLHDELSLASALWPTKIVVLERAYRSADEFGSGDLDEQWRILTVIATVLWELHFSSRGNGRIEDLFYEKTGFELALTEKKLTKGNAALMKMRMVEYQGNSVDIRAHVKGKSGDPKRAFRVYYYPDQDGKKIVIGHCGAHLKTAGTQRLS